MVPIFVAVIIVAVMCFKAVKKSINRKDAQSGKDKERVYKAAESLLRESGYQMIYAHWEKMESYARTVWTTYYQYVIAYQGQTMLVIPLHIDKKTREVQGGQPTVYSPENLGKVTVTTKRKTARQTILRFGWVISKEKNLPRYMWTRKICVKPAGIQSTLFSVKNVRRLNALYLLWPSVLPLKIQAWMI